MSWDIVFIHKAYQTGGYSFFYPEETLLGALQTNKDARIFYIAPRQPEFTLPPQVTYLPISDYLALAEPFRSHYVHFSPNGLEGERFCFERWFILQRLAQQYQIKKCLQLDSDVLLLDDIRFATELLSASQCSVGDSSSPHTNFIADLAILDAFCQFIASAYDGTNTRLRKRLLEMVADGPSPLRCNATISDMTFWRLFLEWHQIRFTELKQIRDGWIFDHNINISQEGFELISDVSPLPPTVANIKNLRIQKSGVYCRYLPTEQIVRFRSLHFQGPSKRWITAIRQMLHSTGAVPTDLALTSSPTTALTATLAANSVAAPAEFILSNTVAELG